MPQQTFEERRFMILDPIKELDNFYELIYVHLIWTVERH